VGLHWFVVKLQEDLDASKFWADTIGQAAGDQRSGPTSLSGACKEACSWRQPWFANAVQGPDMPQHRAGFATFADCAALTDVVSPTSSQVCETHAAADMKDAWTVAGHPQLIHHLEPDKVTDNS
jgi:hypothetical protein